MPTAPSSPQLTDLAAVFRRHLNASKKSSNTVALYTSSVAKFCAWLAEQQRPVTLAEFTRPAVRAWLADLGEQAEVATVRTRLQGVRRFALWLVTEGDLDKAPTDGVAMPAPADTMVRVFSDDEIARMLKTCTVPRPRAGTFDRAVFDGRRDEVILRMLIDCGLRVAELAGAKIEDVDLDQELVYVVGKGNRPRAVPYGPRTAQAVDRYLRARSLHPKARMTTQLLLGQRGGISTDGIRWRLESIAQEAEVPNVHPHAFRHTFAHRWLLAGGQERDLMRLAGWRSTTMLSVYARSTADVRAREAHRKMRADDVI